VERQSHSQHLQIVRTEPNTWVRRNGPQSEGTCFCETDAVKQSLVRKRLSRAEEALRPASRSHREPVWHKVPDERAAVAGRRLVTGVVRRSDDGRVPLAGDAAQAHGSFCRSGLSARRQCRTTKDGSARRCRPTAPTACPRCMDANLGDARRDRPGPTPCQIHAAPGALPAPAAGCYSSYPRS
jgi:hypothetical protein